MTVEEEGRETGNPLPVYEGPTRLLDWGHQGSRGMWVDLRLVHHGKDGSHPFGLYRYGQDAGQRMRILARLPSGDPDAAGPEIYAGESLLLNWSVTGARGMMVRLELDDGPDGVTGRNPFFGLELGKNTGEPIELVAYAIADDETIVDAKKARRKVPFHQMTSVQQANILALRPDFVRFLVDHLERLVPDAEQRGSLEALRDRPKLFADAVTRAYLKVPSRSVMNQDGPVAANARMLWLKLMTMWENETYGIRR